jgi:hypothetical protein
MNIKSMFAGAVMVFGLATGVNAQGLKLEELRLNVASLNLTGGTSFDFEFPGSASAGFFFNEQMALEPSVGVFARKGYNQIGAAAALAYYFNGDHGKAGLFVAPTVEFFKAKGVDASVNYGGDVGFKVAMRDNVSARLAGTIRDGDDYTDVAFGASLGFSFYINK